MYVINKHKIAKACLAASASLLLANCGFGSRDADPLRGKEESYVSQSQKDSEAEKLKKDFEVESQKYKDSIAVYDAKIEASAANQEAIAIQNKERYEKAQFSTRQQCQGKIDKYVAESTVEARKCSDHISSSKAEIKRLDAMVSEYNKRLSNPEMQEFEGILHEFNANGAKAQSYSFKSGEKSEYEVEFYLKVGNKAVEKFDFIGEKPEGLSFAKHPDKENIWVLSGTPTQEIPDGEFSLSTEYTVGPEILYSNISDKREIDLLKLNGKDFSQPLRIVIEKAILKPTITTKVLDADAGADLIEVKVSVTDPASVIDNRQPSVIITHNSSAGTKADPIINGAVLITLDPRAKKKNPTRDGETWVFHYVFNKNLARDYFKLDASKTVSANFNIQAQSQSSGLLSEIDNDIPIKIEKGEQ